MKKLLTLSATSLALAASAAQRPNILLVTCEDISPYLGCYGDEVATSPNIDRFASEGVMFTDMHTTIGVSAPSRFAIITGMYPSAMGANYMRTYVNIETKPEQYPEGLTPYQVILPDEVKAFTEYLREEGYYCINNGKSDYQFNAAKSTWNETGGKASWRNCPEGMPFFVMSNLMETHESRVWVSAQKPITTDPNDIVVPLYYPDNDTIRRDMAIMYSNITRMDQQFQDILDALEEDGLADNTIVIFMSDNGGPLPRQKRAIYESGTRVPFIVRYPDGESAGVVNSELAMFVDISATILSLAGIEPPKHLHGEALLGKYKHKKERDYIYAARNRVDEKYDNQAAVRDHRFRYIRNYDIDHPNYIGVGYRLSMPMMRNVLELYERGELNEAQSQWFSLPRPAAEFYDDVADPHSVNNLIDDPQYAEDIARLKAELDRWLAEENPDWSLSEQQRRELILPNNGEQPVLAPPTISKRGKTLEITSDNSGASIIYKVNGHGDTKSSWYLYTSKIKGLKSGDVVTAEATRAGYKSSTTTKYIFKASR
ncbi:MAG: sulfatase [Rikenellaceae bacterium]